MIFRWVSDILRSRLFKFTFYPVVALVLLYLVLCLLLISPYGQRSFLYLNKLHTAYFFDITKPEHFGFLENQVKVFNITTPDNENLFAWHVLPLSLYMKNRDQVVQSKAEIVGKKPEQNFGIRHLQDSAARLVIYFHGNAGHLADSSRPEALKNFMTCDTENLHILTFDYRGFGLSSGSPTEEGLINDGVAVVNWAIETAKVKPENIVLVGHSLGTAVATGVISHFHDVSDDDSQPKSPWSYYRSGYQLPATTFGGLVLVSGFSSITRIALDGYFKGFIPLLWPFPRITGPRNYIARHISEQWDTEMRLINLSRTRNGIPFPVRIVHASNDADISRYESDRLYDSATDDDRSGPLRIRPRGLGEILRRTYTTRHGIKVKQTLLPAGGHNGPMTHAAVAADICDCLYTKPEVPTIPNDDEIYNGDFHEEEL